MPDKYQVITNVADLQAELRTLLAAELGTFSDGRKAISVEPPYQPQGVTVAGLECIIQYEPSTMRSRGIVNSAAERQYDWIVDIIQFDKSLDGVKKFHSACEKIRARFPWYRDIPLMSGTESEYLRMNFRLNFTTITPTLL